MCWKSVRDPQPAVARPDVLPHAHDAAARIRLHRTRDQEPGPPFHAIKTFFPPLMATILRCVTCRLLMAFLFVLSQNK